MAELIADLFVSVDGFAAGVDVGAFFGYSGPGLDAWIGEATEQPQLMLMGRVTYEALAAISSEATDEASTRMNDLPKAVFSNTLREPLSWRNTRLVRGDLAERITALKRESDVPLRSIGSLTLVRSLMELGLVDRLRVMVFPLTLGGDGREPAYAGYPRTGLQLAGTRVLDSRIVLLEYRPGASSD
ncbi:dihydrofolate reductase family protein [Microbispora rosea]|uniref:dihydrofolate reductase family protein n=1 Tax=Microbispora rosea TaxID=58117 RepID=UPI00379B78D4